MSEPKSAWRDEDRLDRRIAQGRLRRRHVRALARELAALHAAAPVADEASSAASPGRLGRRLRGDLSALSEDGVLPNRMGEALEAQQYDALIERLDALLDRMEDGRVRRLHGNLRDARIWLRGRRSVRLTAPAENVWGDVCEDLAPLTVMLRAAARSNLAETLLATYARTSDDYSLYRVIDVHELAAACRMAREADRSEALRLLAVAEEAGTRASRAQAERPLLLALHGPVASGKSTASKALARRFGAVRVINDRVRDAVLAPITDAVGRHAALERMTSRDFDQRVYAAVFDRARAVLESGRPCVLDGCYPDRANRRQVVELAESCGAELVFVGCRAAPESRRTRLAARDARDGLEEGSWLELADSLEQRMEPLEEDEGHRQVVIDTDLPPHVAVETVCADALPTRRGDTSGLVGTRRLTAVTFDCWNTLLEEHDWHEAHGRRVEALVAAAQEGGVELDFERAGRAFDAAWSKHMELWSEGVATGAHEVARWALERLDLAADPSVIEHLVATFQEASHSSRVVALDGARETLFGLQSRGIRLGLICDTGLTPGRVVRRHLERCGLLETLEAQVFSDEVGVPKPDARIFRVALETLGVAPEETIHVGDLRRTDIAGARALGMRSVRIRASHDDDEALAEADGVANDHAALQRLLGIG